MFAPTHLLKPAVGVMIHFIPDKGAAQIFKYRGGWVSLFFAKKTEKPPFYSSVQHLGMITKGP